MFLIFQIIFTDRKDVSTQRSQRQGIVVYKKHGAKGS